MEKNKSLTNEGITAAHLILIFASCAMVAVSIYLTKHYFDVHYPSQLINESSLCHISSFFNCDSSTYSKIASVFGVPIAFGGLLFGLFLLTSSLFSSPRLESTMKYLSYANLAGCIVLFFYSLIILKSLCPFCTLYYILSAIVAYLFFKYSKYENQISLPGILSMGLFFLATSYGISTYNSNQKALQESLSSQIIQQYFSLPNEGDPIVDSNFVIHAAKPTFKDAPIRITIFSDFQCPFCKKVAEQMDEVIKKYPDQVNIQYFFYPLDSFCNSNMKNAMHEFACLSAFVAACDVNKFKVVHDEIFKNQEKLNLEVLSEIEKKFQLQNCQENKDIQQKVISMIEQANIYKLKSTPTILINGVKIVGSIPNNQLYALFDEILKKNNQ